MTRKKKKGKMSNTAAAVKIVSEIMSDQLPNPSGEQNDIDISEQSKVNTLKKALESMPTLDVIEPVVDMKNKDEIGFLNTLKMWTIDLPVVDNVSIDVGKQNVSVFVTCSSGSVREMFARQMVRGTNGTRLETDLEYYTRVVDNIKAGHLKVIRTRTQAPKADELSSSYYGVEIGYGQAIAGLSDLVAMEKTSLTAMLASPKISPEDLDLLVSNVDDLGKKKVIMTNMYQQLRPGELSTVDPSKGKNELLPFIDPTSLTTTALTKVESQAEQDSRKGDKSQ